MRAYKLFILVLPFALACGKGAGTPGIGRWQRYELAKEATGWSNPFTDVQFSGVFSSPSGREVSVEGFYDGDGAGGVTGDVFKLRFAPDEIGRWSFRTQSNNPALDSLSGAFECVESAERGPLYRDPAEPWYLKWSGSGEPFFESGPNDPEAFLASRFMTDDQRREAIDYLDSVGCNILYFGLVNAGPGDGGPRLKVHPWVEDSTGTPEFDTLCLLFMNRLEKVLDRMREKRIVAHIVFYLDDCGGISKNITTEQEERWFRYMVARFGSYPDIVWNLAEEYQECFSDQWCEGRAALLHRIDPLHHPVTVHQLSSDRFNFAGSANFDLTAMQYNYFAPDSLNAMIRKVRDQVVSAGRPVPVSLIEWNPIAPNMADVARRGIWSIATGGGTCQIFNKDERPGSERPETYDFRLWAEHWRYARVLKELMQSLPLERMRPDNSLVSQGFCLAAPGEAWLVFLPRGGELTLTLPESRTPLHLYWIDPRTGDTRESGVSEGGEQLLDAPGPGDWALLVTVKPRE